MALEGTHIRFALEMKDRYQVSDLGKFLSGAIYPDSRYATGIERVLTHPLDFRSWNLLKMDDFKKGWYAHLLYDQIQQKIMIEMIPDILAEGKGGQNSEYWVRLSSVKNLQDIDDVQKIDLKSYLQYLDYVENPNGENLEDLKRYNKNFQMAYQNPPTIENCVQMWQNLGISAEVEDKVRKQTILYSKDEKIMNAIKQLYDQTLKIA